MRRDHHVVELAEGMIGRQRLDGEHVDAGAGDLLLLQSLQQRRLVDDRSARGVDDIGRRLHAGEVGGPNQAAGARAQHDMDGDDVGGGQQLFLAGVADAGFLAFLRRQVRAPGDHVHAKGLPELGDLGAELAEPNDAERAALDLVAEQALPGHAGMHARVLAADIAGQFEDQAHGQRRGRDRGKRRCRNTRRCAPWPPRISIAALRIPEVTSSFRFGSCSNSVAGKRGALAHGEDDLEILQRRSRLVLRRKGLLEHGEIDTVLDLRPVRGVEREFQIVVEDCTAQPRHGEVRFPAGDGGRGRRPPGKGP